MNNDQRVGLSRRNEGSGNHCFAKRRWGTEDADLVSQDGIDGLGLLSAQGSVEGGVDRISGASLVFHAQLGTAVLQ